MYKVIVERPRSGKRTRAAALFLRNDMDGPMRLGMRARYDHLDLNENLQPLRRYLQAQIGRPWDKVYSEICARIDRRNTVQQHIHQHIDDFIAVKVREEEGKLIAVSRGDPRELWYHELYVDPRTGIIREHRRGRRRRSAADWRKQREEEIAARRRIVNERTLLLRIDGIWFRVEVAPLPDGRTCRGGQIPFDAVLKRPIIHPQQDADRLAYLYGSETVYGLSKRQAGRRELFANGIAD
ncbi:MAG TPA: hypothetical protein VGM84_02280 [Steroidobacteraceae bacterium]|jgi:hypothetical protein